MIGKFLEVRDRATFIPVFATQLQAPKGIESSYLIKCAGFGSDLKEYIHVKELHSGAGTWDEYDWEKMNRGRTMFYAHKYIKENFEKLKNGEVVDVEFILGEKTQPSFPQMLEMMKDQILGE